MSRKYGIVAFNTGVVPVNDPPPPPPAPTITPEDAATAKFAADAARAEAEKLKKELEKLQAQMPSDEQRAHWAQLESEAQKAEEERMAKAGQFDEWRRQVNERHQREIEAERQNTANALARAEAIERELSDRMIGLEFAGASEWFGPSGKTVLLADMAQKIFSGNVSVDVQRDANGVVTSRTVVVRNNQGAVIVDPKTGKPAAFTDAIGELINTHPNRAYLLRGSGKVGSGSAGGGNSSDGIDLARLKPEQFNDPKVREAVRQQQNSAGGLQIGPGFDRLQKLRK